MALRHDRSQIRKPVKTSAGYLRADGRLTRTGIFAYDDEQGNVVRELRHPDEVFAPASLDSLRMVPVTDGHPPKGVDHTNAHEVTRGSVADDVRADGMFVASTLTVYAQKLIEKAESGTCELSCGYICDVDPTPGEYNGERYDAVQKNIRYNHVAIVPKGRAGSEVRLRMDGDDARAMVASLDAPPDKEGKQMAVKLKIGNAEHDVDPAVADAYKAQATAIETNAARITELESQISAGKKNDAARADVATEKARADALQVRLDETLAKIPTMVQEHVALIAQAHDILESDEDLSKSTAREIRAKCIAHMAPSLKLDGVDDAYVKTSFETLVATRSDEVDPTVGEARRAAGGAGEPEKKTKADGEGMSPRDRMIQRQAEQANAKKGAA